MSIVDKIRAQRTVDMKAGDKFSVSVLRMMLAAIEKATQDLKDQCIKKKVPVITLTEDEVGQVLRKFREDTLEEIKGYRDGGNETRARELEASLLIINQFVPADMSSDEVIEFILSQYQPGMNQGALMKLVMPTLKGKAKGEFVKTAVDMIIKGQDSE